MSKVTSLFGGLPPSKEVNATTVETLENLLEQAKSGEISGVAVAIMHHDNLGSFVIAGRVGSYSMLGALTAMKLDLTQYTLEI